MDDLGSIVWLRSRFLPGVDFLRGTHNCVPISMYHERFAVCAVLRGHAEWRYRGQSGAIGDGGLMFLEPGECSVTSRIHRPGDFLVVLVDPGPFLEAAASAGLAAPVHFRLRREPLENPAPAQAIRRLVASVEAQESPLEQQSRLAVCLQRMLAEAESMPGLDPGAWSGPAIHRALECLREGYREGTDLETLAALTGLNRFHLVHAFCRAVGMPPHAFQVHVRVERARALMLGGIPPNQAGRETGFADQSHFTRHFRKILGITPGRYFALAQGDPSPGFHPN